MAWKLRIRFTQVGADNPRETTQPEVDVCRFVYRTTTRVAIEEQRSGIAVNPALHGAGLAPGRVDFHGPVVHRRDRHGDARGLANIGAEPNPATVTLEPMTEVYVGNSAFAPADGGQAPVTVIAPKTRTKILTPSSAIGVTAVAFDPAHDRRRSKWRRQHGAGGRCGEQM